MKIRVYTIYNYLDIETKDNINTEVIEEQLEEGNTVLIEKKDGNTFILNNLNVLAIEIVKEKKNMPPSK